MIQVCPFVESCATRQIPQDGEKTFCLIHEHCDRRKKLEAINKEARERSEECKH